MVGAYRLVRELGAGGMGVVWLAERADGLFTRPVALKLPHLGLQAKVFAERFARERAILAGLDHPHIARLYDAGITAHGQPFLAIEYVEGESLNVYCDRQRLGVAARLKLFVDVLHAVQYAHSQLVVHRDLKPANILVTREGQVKLLDFGIARLLADTAAEKTSLTQLGGRALTPDYASPEQIMGGAIGTASDIYSLGVLLYELLTGRRPYKLKRDTRSALEDAIVAVDVKRPSEADIEPSAATERGSDVARLRRQLKGDLDTIVLKAMASQPPMRFTTCSGFADDLQRHLDGLPVLARPESGLYRMRKFVLRHRLAVGVASAVAVLVVGSAAVALVQGAKAREEAARADAIRQFVVGVFERNSAAQPDPAKARSTTVRQLLDLGRDQLLNKPPGEAAVAQALLGIFSELYFQLGLGTDALQLDRARLEMNRKAFGELDPRTLEAQRDVAQVLVSEGTDADETYALATDLIAKLDRIGDRESLLRAQSEMLLAETLGNRGDDASFVHHRRAIELMGRRYTEDREYPTMLANFARSQGARGDLAGARASVTRAIEAWSRSTSPLQTYGAYVYGIAGQIYEANDDLRAAEAALREGMRIEREHYGDSWQAQFGWVRLARLLTRSGRTAEVLQTSPEVLARLDAARDAPPWFVARAQSLALAAAVDAADARAMAERTNALQRLTCNHDDALTDSWCREALLESFCKRGDKAAAAALLHEIATRTQLTRSRRPVKFAEIESIALLTSAGRAHVTLGSLDSAAGALRQARDQLERTGRATVGDRSAPGTGGARGCAGARRRRGSTAVDRTPAATPGPASRSCAAGGL